MNSKTQRKIREIVWEQAGSLPSESVKSHESDAWKALRSTGTELWLDSGDMEAAFGIWDRAFAAFTTNNTLLNKEVQKGMYDQFIPQIAEQIIEAAPELKPRELLLEIHFVLNAIHGLRMAETFNTHVSVELHTDLANEVQRTVEHGTRMHDICPKYFCIKVPFTAAGLLAARQLSQQNIPVNLTLGFSVRQNYLAARLAEPAFVNVFLGRLNSFVDQSGLGSGDIVGEKTTLATQKMLRNIRETGQTPTRLIGASIRDPEQIATLAGVDVLTIPPAVAGEYVKNPPKKLQRSLKDDRDLHVSMRPGFTTSDFNGQSLWDLAEPVHCAIANLMAKDIDTMTPDEMLQHFEKEKVSDFMPTWTVKQIDNIMQDGKIPSYEKWSAELRGGEVGLDALMNMSALCSFVEDQRKLDQHIESKLEMQLI